MRVDSVKHILIRRLGSRFQKLSVDRADVTAGSSLGFKAPCCGRRSEVESAGEPSKSAIIDDSELEREFFTT